MIKLKDLSKQSRKTYITSTTLLYLYYFMCLILLFQLGRSITAYYYSHLDIFHLVKINVYLIGVIVMSPTIIPEIKFIIKKSKENEM